MNDRGINAHFTGYHGALLQQDSTIPRCKLIQRCELVGKGDVDANANVLETRQGGVEVEVRMAIGDGGTEEDAQWEISEEERHRPRM
jgi:hypothetical protein